MLYHCVLLEINPQIMMLSAELKHKVRELNATRIIREV